VDRSSTCSVCVYLIHVTCMDIRYAIFISSSAISCITHKTHTHTHTYPRMEPYIKASPPQMHESSSHRLPDVMSKHTHGLNILTYTRTYTEGAILQGITVIGHQHPLVSHDFRHAHVAPSTSRSHPLPDHALRAHARTRTPYVRYRAGFSGHVYASLYG
jgi:hypothetical protein